MKKLKKILSTVLYILSAALIIWFVASYVDVVADNTSMNPEHADWNLFVIFTEMI